MSETQALTIVPEKPFTLDQQVQVWLHAKQQRSLSGHTLLCYQRQMQSFRDVLHQAGCDLDGDPSLIATLAQGWASRPMLNDLPHHVGTLARYNRMLATGVSSGTFNNKVSSISSWFEFAMQHDWITRNPMKMVDSRPPDARNFARHMEMEDLSACLQRIDRSTLLGKRDYALLLLAVMTGRRLAEFGLTKWGDLQFDSHGRVICFFPHCKGGKQMEDLLEPELLDAILEYMHALYPGVDLETLPPETPLWVSLRGERTQLVLQSIRQIWIARLGTSKVHTTRHSFAIAMLKVGADISDIASRLGHSNAATTGVYLKRAQQAENKYGAKLMQGFIGQAQQ